MKVNAIIERAKDGGFTIHSPEVFGVYAPAPTESEAKVEFMEMLEEQAEEIKEQEGKYPQWYMPGGEIEVEYKYSLSGFFEAFPFFNASKFAEAVGINPSLMRRYKRGNGGISNKQKQLIQAELEKVLENLQAVQL